MTISTFFTPQPTTVGHEQVLPGPEFEQQEPNARMVQRPASQTAEFFSIVPGDARLQVLDFVVRNRPSGLAYEELSSYAQTSRQARQDVGDFLQLAQDFNLSLLATRTLTNRAWAQASGAPAIKLREYEDQLFAAAKMHSAIYADLAYQQGEPSLMTRAAELFAPATAATIGPQSIRFLLMPGQLKYLHLRLGHVSADKAGDGERAIATLQELVRSSQILKSDGKQLPKIFLDFMHLQPFLLLQQLASAESCPLVTGLSFKANPEHAGEIYPLGTRGKWVENLSKFKQVRYLRFAGFHADIVLDAIYGWLQKNTSLQEFHWSCDYLSDKAFNLLCNALLTHPHLRLLNIEGHHQQSFSKSAQNALSVLLKRKPDLQLVLGRQLVEGDPLTAFPKQVICDHYPAAARAMPEVWGWGDAWHESET